MAKQKLVSGKIPATVMEYILTTLQRLNFGEVVLVAQNGVLMQLEWNEKLRIDEILVLIL